MPKKLKYPKEYLDKALEEIQAQKISVRGAGIKYQIPRATLQFKLKNPNSKSSCGPDPILTQDEEGVLVKWLVEMSRRGFPGKREEVLDTVQKFLATNPRINPFKENRPGRGWLRAFLKRHPLITERTSEGVSRASACVTEPDIRTWFSEIKEYLAENDLTSILDDPSRIFNADETGFQTCPATGRVLAPKGEKNVYTVEQGKSKESITVLFTFSADGKTCPPVIVYPYKRLPEKLATTVSPEWGIARSDSGWMTADVFSEFITDVFSPYLTAQNIQRPVVLFIDGHKSHITLQLSILCKENGIELIALYPNTTRITQPADVAVFGPVKKMWRKEVRKFQTENIGEVVTKQVFSSILKRVVDGLNADHLIQGFRACGLYPFDENAIDYTKCLAERKDKNENVPVDKTMTYEDFCEIVGQEKVKKFDTYTRGSGMTEADDVMYNLWKFFKKNETNSHAAEIDNALNKNTIQLHSTEFATTNLQVSNNSEVTEIKITVTPVKAPENHETPQASTSAETKDDQEKVETLKRKSVSIQDFLQNPPENKRKFVRNVERTPFVITSGKFRDLMEKKKFDKEQKENEKIEKKKKREELATAKKIKQEEKQKNGTGSKKNKKTVNIQPDKKPEKNILVSGSQKCPEMSAGPSKAICILSNTPVPLCFVCKGISLKQKVLLCSSCRKTCHRSCVPKKHKNNLPEEEDMSDFLCHKCYTLDDDDDSVDSVESMTIEDMYKNVDLKKR